MRSKKAPLSDWIILIERRSKESEQNGGTLILEELALPCSASWNHELALPATASKAILDLALIHEFGRTSSASWVLWNSGKHRKQQLSGRGGNFRWLKLSGFFEDLEMCLSADRAPENLTVDKANIFTREKKPPVPRFWAMPKVNRTFEGIASGTGND